MKIASLLYACLLLLVTNTALAYKLKTPRQTQSYVIGMALAKNLQQIPIPLEPQAVVEGLKSELGLTKKLLGEEEFAKILASIQENINNGKNKQQQTLIKKNTQEGETYLAKNAKKKGVITTASGLQYEIIRKGKGKKPQKSDTVEVHYRGIFINGEEFDSSYKRKQTAKFPLTNVIAGWTEVLQLMPVGSKFKVAIPGKLAYGNNGRPSIGPNRTLLFDIELISIQ